MKKPPPLYEDRREADAQAARWLMRQHLAQETTRVVTGYWWGVYSVEEALRDLRGQAHKISKRNGVPADLADAVAAGAFDEEMQRHEAEHETSVDVMTRAALACLHTGMNEAQTKAAIAQHAKDRPIAPPLYLVTQAWEKAKREYSFAQRALKVRR